MFDFTKTIIAAIMLNLEKIAKKIPTKISQLENDKKYITPEEVDTLTENKLDKSGHTPNMFLGTSESGEIEEKSAPELLTEQIEGGTKVILKSFKDSSEIIIKDISADNIESALGYSPADDKDVSKLENRYTSLNDKMNKFGGTVEVTSSYPEKENTVLTIDPESEEIGIYSTVEIDHIVEEIRKEIQENIENNVHIDVDSEINAESENPVQNKVISKQLNMISNKSTEALNKTIELSKDVEEISSQIKNIETNIGEAETLLSAI